MLACIIAVLKAIWPKDPVIRIVLADANGCIEVATKYDVSVAWDLVGEVLFDLVVEPSEDARVVIFHLHVRSIDVANEQSGSLSFAWKEGEINAHESGVAVYNVTS
jgi:hypothetical protein